MVEVASTLVASSNKRTTTSHTTTTSTAGGTHSTPKERATIGVEWSSPPKRHQRTGWNNLITLKTTQKNWVEQLHHPQNDTKELGGTTPSPAKRNNAYQSGTTINPQRNNLGVITSPMLQRTTQTVDNSHQWHPTLLQRTSTTTQTRHKNG